MRVDYLTRAHFFAAIEDRADTVVGTIGHMAKGADIYTLPRHGFAYVDSGDIYAVAGIVPLWDGCGEIWAIPTKRAKQKSVTLGRHLLRTIDNLSKDLKMRRVQAAVRVGHHDAHRLVQSFKMEKEGLMKMYGPDGKDYVRYAKWPRLSHSSQ